MNCAMVILNYRDGERAIKLALNCAEFKSIDKIVLVDNYSNDGSFEKMRKITDQKIEVIETFNNGGFAKGNNYGANYIIEKYNPKYIFFANTDTAFLEQNITACLNALEKYPEIGLISTRMKGPDGKEQEGYFAIPTYHECIRDYFYLGRRYYAKNEHYPNSFYNKVEHVEAVRGSFMFFRTEALKKAGMFDENTFMYCEESIISMRLKRVGYGVGLCTDQWYLHDHLESKSNPSVIAMQRLYQSRFYMMVNYMKIGIIKQMCMRILARYSIFEWNIVMGLKKILHR